MAPPPVKHSPCPVHVVDLAHRRWTLPLLAGLDRSRASRDPTCARLVGLMHHLDVGRESLRQTLDFATAHGWVTRNPGHGHPLRPEYVLTQAGLRVAPACEKLLRVAADLGASEAIARKWTLPIFRVLAEGPGRFGEIKAALGPRGVTDRALSVCLRGLVQAGLLHRRVIHEHPPGVLYAISERARPLADAVTSL